MAVGSPTVWRNRQEEQHWTAAKAILDSSRNQYLFKCLLYLEYLPLSTLPSESLFQWRTEVPPLRLKAKTNPCLFPKLYKGRMGNVTLYLKKVVRSIDKSAVHNRATQRKPDTKEQAKEVCMALCLLLQLCPVTSISSLCPTKTLRVYHGSGNSGITLGLFLLLILCFDAQIWLSSSMKVTPKACHQRWQADVLWPFYICFSGAWGCR